MGLRALLAACSVAVFLLAAAGEAARPAPSLRLADRQPLTVVGNRFVRGETVRLTLTRRAKPSQTRRAFTGARGSFRAAFDAGLGRCETATVRAIGSEGNRAVLKVLPAPACQTA